jgi:hypothetical protein
LGGWEKKSAEEAMIGVLRVETRHRHFSFDQMIPAVEPPSEPWPRRKREE